MSGRRRALAWAGGAAVTLSGTVAGLLLFEAGLEDADRWSSVASMTVTVLVGVPASLYQVILARRALNAGGSTGEVHVTAGGNRSIAAQTVGHASTGDDRPVPGVTPPAPPASSARVRIEATGERSIAGQHIGSGSTGDTTEGGA